MNQAGIDCVGMLIDMIELRKTEEASKQYSPTLIVRGSTLKK
jgi:DNA-binding LacI/PurR family transcriptional regulator